MKKVIAIFLFTSISFFSFAQNFNFGIQAGPSFSKISKTYIDNNNNDLETDYLVGFHAGVYTKFGIGDFSIQPEANFSTKGFKRVEDIKNTSFKTDYRTTLSYLDVPILFQANVAKVVYLFAGPQVSFLVSQKTKGTIYDSNGNSLSSQNTKLDDFNTTEASFVFGGKVKVDKLSIGARYNFGLTDVYKNDPSNEKARNNWFQLTLGIDLI